MFGSHLSIAGGMHNALLKAEQLGCDSLQVFTNTQSHLVDEVVVVTIAAGSDRKR